MSAQTVRIANQGDSLSMDPHSLNESLQLVTGNVYEALVGRNKDLEPGARARHFMEADVPTVWRFELRKGVQFDGTPFTADDVVFSFERTQVEGVGHEELPTTSKQVRKINDHTVEIETKAPFPILPDVISLVYIMSKKWCETNQAQRPVDRRKGIEMPRPFPCQRHGPIPPARAPAQCPHDLVRNGNYWGKIDGSINVKSSSPRSATPAAWRHLLSGEVDVMEPVPVQDIDRINAVSQYRGAGGSRAAHDFHGHGPEA